MDDPRGGVGRFGAVLFGVGEGKQEIGVFGASVKAHNTVGKW